MPVDWMLVATIATPVATLVIGIALERYLERRPKLVAYYGHISAFTMQGAAGPTVIHTHSIVVTNGGRKPATNVRVGHAYLPSFSLNPSVQCTSVVLPSGGNELVFPTLVPGEQVTVSYLYFPPIYWNQINTYVKSDEGMATVITVLPTRQYPRWAIRIGRVVLFAGAVALLYVGFVAGKALINLIF